MLMSMNTKYPQMVDQHKSTIGGLPCAPHFVNAHAIMADEQFIEIGERLAKVRQGFSDLNQRAWAEKHGFQNTQWNNWENGVRRIPVESAERLCHLYGLSLDWIYLGRRSGLAESASKVL